MMNDRRPDGQARHVDPGLCATCAHVQRIVSAKGSEFYLCRLSATDPRFPRYPPLPVVRCQGYTPTPGSGG